MTPLDQTDVVGTQEKTPENKSGVLKSVMVATALLSTQVQAGQLLKTDPIVVAKCDKNGDSKIKWPEYLCFLDMKKQRLDDKSQRLDNKSQRLDDERKKLKKQILNNIKIAQK